MTAPARDARPTRRSHAEDLWYLVGETKKIPDGALGDVFRLRLERAAHEADGLDRADASRADELAMLRAEAYDRERALAAVQAVRVELAALQAAVAGSLGEGADRVRFMLRRMQDVVEKADPVQPVSREVTGV
jgi:hypothetical protein